MANLSSVGVTSENEVDLEGLRVRLRKMNHAELLRFGQAAKSMCFAERLLWAIAASDVCHSTSRKHGQSKSAETQKRNTRDDKTGRPHQC